MIAAHVAGIVWSLACLTFVTAAFLAICACIHSGRVGEPPHVPADVDLDQAVATTRAIAYGTPWAGGRV